MSSNAQLYDDLDLLYRELWSNSLHHGLWIKGHESPQEARDQLADRCLVTLNPQAGDTIADIGCGYGTLCHRITGSSNCQVHAFTNSHAQIQAAQPHPDIVFHHQDWLSHSLPKNSLDKALALESLSHFSSFKDFFSATTSALRPKATLVISDWFAAPHCSPIEKLLLRHLAKAGAIPPWRTFSHLLTTASPHFSLTRHETLSSQVAPTWIAFFKSATLTPLKKPTLILPLLKTALRRPSLLTTFPLLRLAYHLGILEYHLCLFRKIPSASPQPQSNLPRNISTCDTPQHLTMIPCLKNHPGGSS